MHTTYSKRQAPQPPTTPNPAPIPTVTHQRTIRDLNVRIDKSPPPIISHHLKPLLHANAGFYTINHVLF
jgi:hypothetical protein